MENIEQLNFSQMDTLMDTWIDDHTECKKTFINQADSLDVLFRKMDMNNSMVNNIHSKVQIAHHNNESLMRDLTLLNQYAVSLEELVQKFEKNPSVTTHIEEGCNAVRHQIYSTTENLNNMVYNLNSEIDLVNSQMEVSEKETADLQIPAEANTKIMNSLLQNLESIETKLYQMQHFMHLIDQEKAKLASGLCQNNNCMVVKINFN